MAYKKIYILVNSLKRGGAERILAVFGKRLKYDKAFLLETDTEYDTGVPAAFLSRHTHATSGVWKWLSVPLYAWRLSRSARRGDVVLSSLERSNVVNIFSKLFFRHTAIIWIHISLSSEYAGKKRFARWLFRMLYAFADFTVFVSEGVAADGRAHFGIREAKSMVLYNPVPDEAYHPGELSERYAPLFRHPFLMNVGRLHPQKGQWHLLKLMRDLHTLHPDLKLGILGEGPLLADLFEYARALGIRTWKEGDGAPDDTYTVFFFGLQRDPFAFEKRATLFVFPSHYEGLPLALEEALACGLPVVSSDCPSGPREILAPGSVRSSFPEFAEYGVLLPIIQTPLKPFDTGPLSKEESLWLAAIDAMLRDVARLAGYRERGSVRARAFAVDALADKWNSLLASFAE